MVKVKNRQFVAYNRHTKELALALQGIKGQLHRVLEAL